MDYQRLLTKVMVNDNLNKKFRLQIWVFKCFSLGLKISLQEYNENSTVMRGAIAKSIISTWKGPAGEIAIAEW